MLNAIQALLNDAGDVVVQVQTGLEWTRQVVRRTAALLPEDNLPAGVDADLMALDKRDEQTRRPSERTGAPIDRHQELADLARGGTVGRAGG